MNIEQVREYTLSLYGVTEDQPFGDDIITFRLEGKIFVCLWLGGQISAIYFISLSQMTRKSNRTWFEEIFAEDVLANLIE